MDSLRTATYALITSPYLAAGITILAHYGLNHLIHREKVHYASRVKTIQTMFYAAMEKSVELGNMDVVEKLMGFADDVDDYTEYTQELVD